MQDHHAGRGFLKLADFTPSEIVTFVDAAAELKRRRQAGERFEPLSGKTVAVLFEKPSTRTRVSFQAGIAQLGGQSFFLRPDELQLSRGEPIKDTARIIDRYCEALVIRTFGQEIVEEFGRWMEHPVVNALTNETHPCQGLCDLLTIREKKRAWKGLKVCHLGDIWNVCHSLMMGSAMTGMDFYAGRPAGYDPDPEQVEIAQRWARVNGTKIVYTESLEEAVTDADVVYANTWHSMATENREQRMVDWRPYQVNEQVLALAKPDAIFMHCLPGYRGEEMTEEVIEGPQSVVWDQGENRMHTEKAILALTMEPNIAEELVPRPSLSSQG
jgi:ornithine carbamoyltransferase